LITGAGGRNRRDRREAPSCIPRTKYATPASGDGTATTAAFDTRGNLIQIAEAT